MLNFLTLLKKKYCQIFATSILFLVHTNAMSLENRDIISQDKIHTVISDCNNEGNQVTKLKPIKIKRLDRIVSTLSQQNSKLLYNCLLPVGVIYNDWKNGKALLIDVRNTKYYNKNKIRNSINLPLYSLKFKQNLKNRNIVLINKGAKLSTLENSCSVLKASGFKQISVMKDGLNAWKDAGYSISGDSISIQEISDLQPSEVISVLTERDWAFIDLDHSSKTLHNIVSNPSVIEYTEDFVSLSDKMAAFKAARKPGVITGFLVISQDGRQNRIIKKQFQDFGIKDVYYLSGGVSGFKRFAQKHAAQVERLRKGFQVRMGCNG